MSEATIRVVGTFTKTVADGTGYVDVSLPTDDDEVTIMYGVVTAGAVKAGAGVCSVVIGDVIGGAGHGLNGLAVVAALAAGQNCRFPMLGIAPATDVLSDKPSKESMLLTGTDVLMASLGTMAFGTSETFHFTARFRSKTGKALVVTATGGTWA